MCARGRPHGAAPTNPNERSGWTETPHPSRPSAVPPSPEGEVWKGAPLKAFPFRPIPPVRGPTPLIKGTWTRRPHGAALTAYPVRPSCRGGPACPPTPSGRTHRCAPTAARRVVLRHCEEGRRPDAAIRIPPGQGGFPRPLRGLGMTGRREQSPPYMVRVTRRGAHCAPHNGFPLKGGSCRAKRD